MKHLIVSTILVLAISFFALGMSSKQNSKSVVKPNFTGTWKLNVEKSNFGPTPALVSRIDKLDHQEPSLKVTSTRVQQGGAEDTINLSLTIGDKENLNTLGSAEMKSKLKWDGAVLLIDSTINAGGDTINLKDKWTLSADGKTLTIERHYSAPAGEADVTFVMEKQ